MNYLSKISRLFAFIGFCFLFVKSMVGQGITVSQRIYLQTLTTGTNQFHVTLPDSLLNPFTNNQWRDRQIMGSIRLGVEPHDHACYTEKLGFRLDLPITFSEHDSTNYVNFNTTKLFEASFDPFNTVSYTEQAIAYFPNVYHLVATLNGITDIELLDASGNPKVLTAWSDLPFDLYIELSIAAERYPLFDFQVVDSCALTFSNQMFEFQFSPNPSQSSGAVAYELEYTWISDYNPNGSTPQATLPLSQLAADFTFNSTRVRLADGENTFMLPHVFDRGYLVYRWRSVGRDISDWERHFHGNWSTDLGYGNMYPLSTFNDWYYINENGKHEGDKNWQVRISFAEEGKNKHLVAYADGTERVRQQVTGLSTDQTAVVGQTVYDHQGRGALTILPAPTGINELRYYPGFNLSESSGLAYSRADFDFDDPNLNTCGTGPNLGLSETSGAGNYYSSSNTITHPWDAYIPDAHKFPLNLVQFTPDKTGRIRAQGGLGPDHQIGSGHETRYFYGKPFQEQLDLLFGTDVGYDRFYQKQMVVDPNGQVSVSYLDMNGNVIATSLAGTPPASVTPLKVPGDTQDWATANALNLKIDLLNKSINYPMGASNQIDYELGTFTVISNFLVSSSQTYDFDYTFLGIDYMESCLNDLCMDCIYDIEIEIRNSCGAIVSGGVWSQNVGGIVDTQCNEDESAAFQTSVYLEVGDYQLIKKVAINLDSLKRYEELYLAHDTCLLKLEDFFTMPDTSDCFFDCDSCAMQLAQMGTLQDFINNQLYELISDGVQIADTNFYINQFTTIYNEKRKLCDELCEKPSFDLCDVAYRAMLIDVSPNGQYGEISISSSTGTMVGGGVLSLYATTNLLPSRTNAQLPGFSPSVPVPIPSWRNPRYFDGTSWQPFYHDANGSIERVWLNETSPGVYSPQLEQGAPVNIDPITQQPYSYPHHLQNLEDFVTGYWKPEFSEALVVYHPEYLMYNWCKANTYSQVSVGSETMNSWEYDSYLFSLNQAGASGLLGLTLNPSDLDPFFLLNGTQSIVSSGSWSSMTLQDAIDLRLRFYGGFAFPSTSALSAWETAYIADEYGAAYGYTNLGSLVPSPGLESSQPSPFTDRTHLITNDTKWEQLVGHYLSSKQDIIMLKARATSISLGVSNSCIGLPYEFSYTPGPISDNPCNWFRAMFFTNKTPRFPSKKYIMSQSGFDNIPPTMAEIQAMAGQQYYNETGICPIARDLEFLLNKLVKDGKLLQTTEISPGSFLAEALFNHWNQNVNQGSGSNNIWYYPSTGTNQKSLSFGTMDACPTLLHIAATAPQWVNFSNVQNIYGIHEVTQTTPGAYQFKLHASFTSGSQTWHGVIEGQTCIPLSGCEQNFEIPCKVNNKGLALQNLMRYLFEIGELYASSYTLSIPEKTIMGEELRSLLGGTSINDTYRWQYDPTLDRFVLRNDNSTVQMRINLSGSDWNTLKNTLGFTSQPISIIGFQPNPHSVPTSSPGGNNTLTLNVKWPGVVYPDLEFVQPTHQFNVNISLINSNSPFEFTTCEAPLPFSCSAPVFKNLNSLKEALEGYALTGSSPEEHDCVREVEWLNGGSGPVPPQGTVILEVWPLQEDVLPDGSNYHFLAKVIAPGGLIDTIKGEYCLPIKACESCDPPDCTMNDTIVFSMELTGSFIAMKYGFRFPTLPCISFSPDTLVSSSTMGSESFAVWAANQINSSTPYVHVAVDGSTLNFKIPSSLFGKDCECSGMEPIQLFRYFEDADPVLRASGMGTCCKKDTCIASDSLVIYLGIYVDPNFLEVGDYLTITPFNQFGCIEGFSPFFQLGTLHPDTIVESLVDSINGAFPSSLLYAIPHAIDTVALVIYTSELGSECDCSSDLPIGIGSPQGEGVWYPASTEQALSCCEAEYIVPSFDSPCDSLIWVLNFDLEAKKYGLQNSYWEQLSTYLAGADSEEYEIGMLGYPESFMNGIDSLLQWHTDSLVALQQHYTSLIENVNDTCLVWEKVESLVLGDPCEWELTPFPEIPFADDCAESLLEAAWFVASEAYAQYLDSALAAFRKNYITHCMQILETFSMEYTEQEYSFTLYYYDQANNLIKTVPPRAVTRLAVGDLNNVKNLRDNNSGDLRPDHHNTAANEFVLSTHYAYNSLGGVYAQESPDGGPSKFWYDELGRLVFSQNAEQMNSSHYSYTFYDGLGRIVEVGQLQNTTTLTQSIAGNQTTRNNWLGNVTANSHEQVVKTIYDEVPTWFPTPTYHHNLRNRVAAVVHYQDNLNSNASAATFYSYDIHGNVQHLLQYNDILEQYAGTGHGWKEMFYYYDLISGNVKGVAYNPNGQDRFFHRYSYDADNRIISTSTWSGPGASWEDIGWVSPVTLGPDSSGWLSIDNPLDGLSIWPWEEDARYFYYQHGPLARVELGDLKVQGVDYVYNIHGWLKGINSNSLEAGDDPGRDGDDLSGPNVNRWVGRDAYGFMLDYYAGDYTPIGGSTANRFRADKNASGYGGNFVDLWNGNISGMTTTLRDLQTWDAMPQGAQYRYDQLNRLVGMDVWQDLDVQQNQWGASAPLDDYRTRYHYDANGNILSLQRNGIAAVDTAMDMLTYHYPNTNNRLLWVADAVAAGNYSNDIDNQTSGNYAYDAIGNLIRDDAEEISSISWTVYGKVRMISRSGGSSRPNLDFGYGADGQRIRKTVNYQTGGTPDSTLNWIYVRDAQGNVMAIYKFNGTTTGNPLYLEEHPLYGSSRLGSRKERVCMTCTTATLPAELQGVSYVIRGEKSYELSNHLGNVLAVVSDRREAGACTDSLVDFYYADGRSVSDYYPFGMAMDSRIQSAGGYRWGFNGQEKDDEVVGEGNSYTAEFWQYDSRLGRRWNVDPVVKPWRSPYDAFANSPISKIDPNGADDGWIIDKETGEKFWDNNVNDVSELETEGGYNPDRYGYGGRYHSLPNGGLLTVNEWNNYAEGCPCDKGGVFIGLEYIAPPFNGGPEMSDSYGWLQTIYTNNYADGRDVKGEMFKPGIRYVDTDYELYNPINGATHTIGRPKEVWMANYYSTNQSFTDTPIRYWTENENVFWTAELSIITISTEGMVRQATIAYGFTINSDQTMNVNRITLIEQPSWYHRESANHLPELE